MSCLVMYDMNGLYLYTILFYIQVRNILLMDVRIDDTCKGD